MAIDPVKIIFMFAFGIIHMLMPGQSTDSLKRALKNAVQDTSRCAILAQLAETAPDEEWPAFNDQLKHLCEAKLKTASDPSPENGKFKKYYAAALNNCGYLANQQGNTLSAIEYYTKSIKIQQEINDQKGLAASYNNIGFIYKALGDIPRALDYYNKSIKIQEAVRLQDGQVQDKKGLAYSISNIAIIYQNQDETEKALEYNFKSLKLREEIRDRQGTSVSLNNIGFIYQRQGNYPKALDYFLKSLRLREDIGDKQGTAISLNNVGFIYDRQGNHLLALEYYNRSLSMQQEIRDKSGMSFSLNNMALIYLKQKELGKALEYAQKNMSVSKEVAYPENISNAALTLSNVYKSRGNYKAALESYLLHAQMLDSIKNETTRKASIKSQLKYEYDKKIATDSVAHAKENELQAVEIQKREAEIKAKRNQQYALYGGLALVLVFAGFMYNRFKITQNQNKVITNQKHLIEEKHKEITDSINYAERIQRSFLATKNLLDENLKEYFVFFQPKDVVSGDFYWAGRLKNGNFALATADSTGHGVPGAIMSILNISSLEKAIEHGLSEPSEIFNHTRKTIIERLKKDGSAEGGKDGMDCSLISFDFKNQKLIYSAANNPVWIVRKNQLIELTPDKMPVGRYAKDSLPFTQHAVELQEGDMVYTLTDGMPDQFGGLRGKKFMYRQLKEFLIAISLLPVEEQKKKLNASLNAWKGDLEQVDDITLIGVRI